MRQPEAAGLLLVSLLLGCLPNFDELRSQENLGGAAGVGGLTPGGGMGGSAGSGGNAGTGGTSPGDPCSPAVDGESLFVFDTMNLAGSIAGTWSPYPEGSPALVDSTITWSDSEGHTCPGALSLSVPFDSYGDEKVMALINFQEDWSTPTNFGALHAWLKVPLPESGSLEYLRGVQLSVSSGGGYEAFRSLFLPSANVGDGAWHELVVTLEPLEPPPTVGAFIPTVVRQIGVQVITAPTAPAAGPPAPLPTTVLVDDLWLAR